MPRKPKPPGTKHQKTSITLSPEALAILHRAAKRLGLSRSALIDEMILTGGRWVTWKQKELPNE